jgi:hypothetical protein
VDLAVSNLYVIPDLLTLTDGVDAEIQTVFSALAIPTINVHTASSIPNLFNITVNLLVIHLCGGTLATVAFPRIYGRYVTRAGRCFWKEVVLAKKMVIRNEVIGTEFVLLSCCVRCPLASR